MYADQMTDSMRRAISRDHPPAQEAARVQRRARHRPADGAQEGHRHPRDAAGRRRRVDRRGAGPPGAAGAITPSDRRCSTFRRAARRPRAPDPDLQDEMADAAGICASRRPPACATRSRSSSGSCAPRLRVHATGVAVPAPLVEPRVVRGGPSASRLDPDVRKPPRTVDVLAHPTGADRPFLVLRLGSRALLGIVVAVHRAADGAARVTTVRFRHQLGRRAPARRRRPSLRRGGVPSRSGEAPRPVDARTRSVTRSRASSGCPSSRWSTLRSRSCTTTTPSLFRLLSAVAMVGALALVARTPPGSRLAGSRSGWAPSALRARALDPRHWAGQRAS